MSSKPRISVIVPARSAAATLPACLDALVNSQCRPDEIIVYDDGDNGPLNEYAARDLISIIPGDGERLGRSRGRNLAARRACGEILAFVDADVVVDKEALGRLVAVLACEPGVSAAFGCYDQTPRVKRLAAVYANLRHHWIHYQGDPEAATFWTGLGVVRAEKFWAQGGFAETSKLEDIEFGMRLCESGERIRLVADAQATHLKDWRLLQLWKTDIINRAVPWSLLIARGARGNRLNASPRERLSALLAYGVLISLGGCFFSSWLRLDAVIFAGLYIFINRELFGLIARRGGVRALLAAIALHWVYHLYASAIFVTVMATAKLRAGFAAGWRMLTRVEAQPITMVEVPHDRPPGV